LQTKLIILIAASIILVENRVISVLRKKRWRAFIGLAIIAMMAPACGQAETAQSLEASQYPRNENEMVKLAPVSLGTGEKLRVVATTNIVADIVSQVGGDAIDLTPLLPLGDDPHTYTTTPQDVVTVANAHVIFANGAGLEAEFLPKLTPNTDAPVVYVSQGIELQVLEGADLEVADQEHTHEGVDPHTWTTPVNVIIYVHNIEQALSALDPANATTYGANAKRYEGDLISLDEWVKEQIANIPADNRKLVTDHETFGYYADRYGLAQIGAVIPGFSTGTEPSARELATLEDSIHRYGVRAVFVGTTVNPSLAQQVAADTGVQLVTLYTGSLGPKGSDVETYVDYIRYNTTVIVDALR
jgi:manganese/iron transport system substrate-binding protein